MKYRFRRRVIYTLLIIVDRLFLLIPYKVALGIGRLFGYLGYLILSGYRKLTKRHLRLAFGSSKTDEEIDRIAKEVFINLGIGLSEIFSLPKLKKRLDGIVEVKGIENIDRALKEGRGAVVISAHLGNWELVPMYFAYKGYPANIVARPIYYEKYDEWVRFLRNSMGVNVIYRTESPKKLLALLKKNELVGIMPDQDIDSIEGVFVNFFGRKAYTPTAPAKLALAAKSPLIPLFILRNHNKHTIYVENPIYVNNGEDKEAAVLSYTQEWSDRVESYIRRYPGQWVWMHKRWKTQP
jgi:KDO2-lipid IV(A) lauroyltransferase